MVDIYITQNYVNIFGTKVGKIIFDTIIRKNSAQSGEVLVQLFLVHINPISYLSVLKIKPYSGTSNDGMSLWAQSYQQKIPENFRFSDQKILLLQR